MNAQFDVPNAIDAAPSDDESALCRIEELIWTSRSRLRSDPSFSADLKVALRECLSLLCPIVEGDKDSLSVVSESLEKVPGEQLDALSSHLMSAASRDAEATCARGSAVCLLAGWLKATALQDIGEKGVRRAAHQLKSDCELLFERLLSEQVAAA